MLPSLNSEIDQLRLVDRPMCVEAAARIYEVPARTVRWAAESGHLKGFRDPTTPMSKCWKFYRADVEAWLAGRGQCN